MATTSAVDGGGSAGECEAATAREFAERVLADAEEPVEPAALKEEYGCSGGHMRNVLVTLTEEGIAERVGHGQYVASSTPQRPPAQEADAAEGAAQEAGDEGSSEAVSEEVEEAVVDDGQEEFAGDELEELDGFALDGEERGLPPGKALVAGTVVLVVLILVLSKRSGGRSASAQDGAEGDESGQQSAASFEGW